MEYKENLLGATLVTGDQAGFLNALPAYTVGQTYSDPLALARELFNANSYFPTIYGYPFGDTSQLTFTARETKEGSLQIPPMTYIWGVSAFGVNAGANSRNFSISIIDKGSGLGFTEREFCYAMLLCGHGAGTGSVTDPRGPFLLRSPLIITNPGQVGIKITNLDLISNVIQIALHCAVPINNRSMGTAQMKGL